MIKKILFASSLIISLTSLGLAKDASLDVKKESVDRLQGFGIMAGVGGGLAIDAFTLTSDFAQNGFKPGTRAVYGGSVGLKLGVSYFSKQNFLGGSLGLEATLNVGTRIVHYELDDINIAKLTSPEYSLELNFLQVFGSNKLKFGYSLGAGVAFMDPYANRTGEGSVPPRTSTSNNKPIEFNGNLITIFDPTILRGVFSTQAPASYNPITDTIGFSPEKVTPTITLGLVSIIDTHHKVSIEFKNYINSYVGFSSNVTLNYAYYFRKK
ncbi:hypothetical protein BKH43_08170 [Helicobacter sp. 13S00401-1]|uniref:hypothetical protein n=1 Tax=Helicobacter sp. 13S00401-1 TaxID=1905758 RepID=UPI000BA50B64|nr:hypothetical protein [Helicobacter sp. 13S00401-1]PAF47615.1 hypothetical protein BKH43_08170 [Helicobacter sp. 13S00401-1]